MRNPPDPLERCLNQTPSRQYLRFDFTLTLQNSLAAQILARFPPILNKLLKGKASQLKQ